MTTGIYGIRNETDGKWYIGQSTEVEHRFVVHKRRLKLKIHANIHLQNAWSKCGEDSFSFFVIEKCEAAVLDAREVAWIRHFNSADRFCGYNKDMGGQCVRLRSNETRAKLKAAWTVDRRASAGEMIRKRCTGKTISEEHKKKIGDAHRGMKRTQHTRENISKALKGNRNSVGHVTSEETRTKIANALLGHTFSDESRRRISESLKGNKNRLGGVLKEKD
jgi:group I intron endonuclease